MSSKQSVRAPYFFHNRALRRDASYHLVMGAQRLSAMPSRSGVGREQTCHGSRRWMPNVLAKSKMPVRATELAMPKNTVTKRLKTNFLMEFLSK